MIGRPHGHELLVHLVHELRPILAQRRDHLVVVRGSHWVALRSAQRKLTFAEVRVRRAHLEVYILPGPRGLGGSSSVVSAVPSSRGWGWFQGRFIVRDENFRRALQALLASHAVLWRRPRIYTHRS